MGKYLDCAIKENLRKFVLKLCNLSFQLLTTVLGILFKPGSSTTDNSQHESRRYQTLTFMGNTTGVSPGFYTVSANARIPDDGDPTNNYLQGNVQEVREPLSPPLHATQAYLCW